MPICPPGVEKVTLDVRDEASIGTAVSEILSHTKRIDVLVNNAGGTLVGAIEEADVSQAQALFDVNFFGAVRITHAVLPAMRAQRSGMGIRSIVIEPGFMKTRIDKNSAVAARKIQDYAEGNARAGAYAKSAMEKADDPSMVAKTLVVVLKAAHPRLRYPVGKSAAMLGKLRRFMPESLFDRGLRTAFHLGA